MSKSEVTVNYKENNYLNTTKHCKRRILERCDKISHIQQMEDYTFWSVSNPGKCRKLDGKLVYCEDLELLGAVEGKTLRTVVRADSYKFEFKDNYFVRQETNTGGRDSSFRDEVLQEVDDRRFERV